MAKTGALGSTGSPPAKQPVMWKNAHTTHSTDATHPKAVTHTFHTRVLIPRTHQVYLARIAELERELRHAKQLNALGGPSRRRTTATHGHHHGARTTAGGAAPTTPAASIPGAWWAVWDAWQPAL